MNNYVDVGNIVTNQKTTKIKKKVGTAYCSLRYSQRICLITSTLFKLGRFVPRRVVLGTPWEGLAHPKAGRPSAQSFVSSRWSDSTAFLLRQWPYVLFPTTTFPNRWLLSTPLPHSLLLAGDWNISRYTWSFRLFGEDPHSVRSTDSRSGCRPEIMFVSQAIEMTPACFERIPWRQIRCRRTAHDLDNFHRGASDI